MSCNIKPVTIVSLRSVIMLVLLVCVCVPILTACDQSSDKQIVDLTDKLSETEFIESIGIINDTDVYYFGFDLRASPQEDARQYLPFLKYLENSTGYKFRIYFTPKEESIGDLLGIGKVQFAAIGATSFLAANNKYGVMPLVRGLNLQGKAEYQSVIVVAKDSGIKTIKGLKGKSLAFGSTSSTQGHLIPRIILNKNGMTINDLGSYHYMGSHQNCANSVVSGKYDACGMQDTMAKNLAALGLVRILHVSEYYPSSGIAVNPKVPDEVITRIKTALLEFEPAGIHKDILYHWHQTEMPNGFVSATVDDYNKLKHWSKELNISEHQY